MIIFLMALAGGLGAGARFVLDGLVSYKVRSPLPAGTMLINISGSLLMGAVAGFSIAQGVPAGLETIVSIGFLGGYTTFSTVNVETVRLVQRRRPLLALATALGTVMLSVPAAAAGLWLTQ